MMLAPTIRSLLLYINLSYCYAKDTDGRCATFLTTDALLSTEHGQGLVERHSDLQTIDVNVWSHIVLSTYEEEPVSEQTIDKQV